MTTPDGRFFTSTVRTARAPTTARPSALNCSGFDETIARLDARGASYQINTVTSIGLRQVFTMDPNQVLLELNFFGD
jgi:hypothetical protein